MEQIYREIAGESPVNRPCLEILKTLQEVMHRFGGISVRKALFNSQGPNTSFRWNICSEA